MPPDGGIDLRGFVGQATFLRGVFDKIGIEPQVQRLVVIVIIIIIIIIIIN